MKVAVFSESGADEAAIRILVDGLLTVKTEPSPMPPLRSRGVGAVFRDLPMVLKYLQYRTNAEALVAVVDSDKSPILRKEHLEPGKADKQCRLHRLRNVVEEVRRELRTWHGRPLTKVALGLAVPEIEAWYLVGRDRHVSEAAWAMGIQSGKFPYTKDSLKRSVYGERRPPIELETECAIREAERIVRDRKLDSLEALFPGGFGALADEIRAW